MLLTKPYLLLANVRSSYLHTLEAIKAVMSYKSHRMLLLKALKP